MNRLHVHIVTNHHNSYNMMCSCNETWNSTHMTRVVHDAKSGSSITWSFVDAICVIAVGVVQLGGQGFVTGSWELALLINQG